MVWLHENAVCTTLAYRLFFLLNFLLDDQENCVLNPPAYIPTKFKVPKFIVGLITM